MTEFPDPVTPEEKALLSELKRLRTELEAAKGVVAKLEYVAGAAILAGYSYRDDDRTEEWFTSKLTRLQKLLEDRP